jgi:hypothetical protein
MNKLKLRFMYAVVQFMALFLIHGPNTMRVFAKDTFIDELRSLSNDIKDKLGEMENS